MEFKERYSCDKCGWQTEAGQKNLFEKQIELFLKGTQGTATYSSCPECDASVKKGISIVKKGLILTSTKKIA